MRREREMERAATSLRTEFPNADPALFDRSFDSVEAFRVAAEDSHRAFEARLAQLGVVPKSQHEAELERYRKAYGELPGSTPTDTGSTTATGDPSIQELAAMPLVEFDKVPKEVIDRVMRSATT